MSLDPYKVLGVAKDANPEAVKSAYRKLARKYHPDVNPGDKASEDKFKEISEAYDILSDPSKKSEYDNLGREAFYERGFGGSGYQRPDFSGSGFSFEDIFGELFGGGRGANAKNPFSFRGGGPAPQKGADQQFRVSISLRDAAHGVEKVLDFEQPATCPQCHGQGLLSAGGGVRSCPNCQGQGRVFTRQSLKAKIPAGVKNGQKVRLKGKGAPGAGGGPAGDLYLEVEVMADPVFTRKEQDLYADWPVSLYEALLGGKVEVPTLNGRASLKLPPASQNGARMRLKGQGLPANKQHEAGDLYITLKVLLPSKLDEAAKEKIKELAELAPVEGSK